MAVVVASSECPFPDPLAQCEQELHKQQVNREVMPLQ